MEKLSEDAISDHLIKTLIERLDSVFHIIEKNSDYFKYQVSQKETLILSTFADKGESDYRFTLKHDEKNPKITYEGGFFMNGNSKKTFDIDSKQFKKLIQPLKFWDQNVNPQLMLLPCSKEERFVKGNLEKWDRVDGLILAKDDLNRLVKQRMQWRKGHPNQAKKGEIKEYSSKECKKAKCVHLQQGICGMGLRPTNFKKDPKLQGATGYCLYYQNPEMIKMEDRLMKKHALPLLMERITFFASIRHDLRQLKRLYPVELRYQEAKPFFSCKKLSRLIDLINQKLSKQQERQLKRPDTKKMEFRHQFFSVYMDLRDYIHRKTRNFAHKKARNDFVKELRALKNSVKEYSRELKNLVSKIKEQNHLTQELFDTSKPVNPLVSFSSMKKGMLLYFIESHSREVRGLRCQKATEHYNVGRVKTGDDWIDRPLSSCYKSLDYHYYPSERYKHPIYEVISVKRSEIILKELFSKDSSIRLLNSREYLAHQIKFDGHLTEANEQRQERLKRSLFLIILSITFAYLQRTEKKISITKQVSLTQFF